MPKISEESSLPTKSRQRVRPLSDLGRWGMLVAISCATVSLFTIGARKTGIHRSGVERRCFSVCCALVYPCWV